MTTTQAALIEAPRTNNTTNQPPRDWTAPHITQGTIYVSSWGWEQTNVDYYIVTKRTAKTITLQPIGTKQTEQLTAMSETVTPDPDTITGTPFRRKLVFGDLVSINSVANARPWNGRAMTQTHWA